MGVYTYTLRAKTIPVELADGAVVKAHVLAYLCRSGDHNRLMFAHEPGFRRATMLRAKLRACEARWAGAEPVYFVLDFPAGPSGRDLYRAEDPGKACVWYDCDNLLRNGVTKVGRIGPRVRRGRRVVWPLKVVDSFFGHGFPAEAERLSGDYFDVDADDPELELGRKD